MTSLDQVTEEGRLLIRDLGLRYRGEFPHLLTQCRCCHHEDAWCEMSIRTHSGGDWHPICVDCAEFITESVLERDRS